MTSTDYTAPEGASMCVPAQKPYSHGSRKPICGLGVNDFHSPIWVNGANIKSYDTWSSMVKRCYSPVSLEKHPTYRGCSVVPEWLSFSAFESWYRNNYFEGAALDKDLLVPGNKVYGPDTCVFVHPSLNSLLVDSRRNRGNHPLGVCYHKLTQKYMAQVHGAANGRNHLGLFLTPLEAHQAWQLAKAEIIENFPTTDPRIRKALDLRVAQLRDDHANNRITTKL